MKIKSFLLFFYSAFFMIVSRDSACDEINTIELHFWPTAVANHADSESFLYSWPEFKILLQRKDSLGSYVPANIDEQLARQLNAKFKPDANSPVRQFRDEHSGYWGLYVPGGSLLSESNNQLANIMVDKLMLCVAELSNEDYDQIAGVIFNPSYYLSSGRVRLNDEQKKISEYLANRVKINACARTKNSVPVIFKERISLYFIHLLTGTNKRMTLTDGELLVITTFFKDLLYSPNGLWAKAVLTFVKDFVESRIEHYPYNRNTNWSRKNYSSFLDLILSTRETLDISINQYLDIAKMCKIESIINVFNSCNLADLFKENKISMLKLNIGSKTSLHFFAR